MIAYIDCSNGVSGNSILGSLIDCGLPFDSLKAMLNDLLIQDDFKLIHEKIECLGCKATYFDAIVKQSHDDQRRSIATIEAIINSSQLSDSIKKKAIGIFYTLGSALATAHQCDIQDVTFHETKAIDTIIDIVGTCWGLAYFNVDHIIASPLHIGSGSVTFKQNKWSIPVPATKTLLENIPHYQTCIQGELVTPTGAAIIKTCASTYTNYPVIDQSYIGYGAPINTLDYPGWLILTIGKEKHETK